VSRVNEAVNHSPTVRVVQSCGDLANYHRYLQGTAVGGADVVLEVVPFDEHSGGIELPCNFADLVQRRDAGVIQTGVEPRGLQEVFSIMPVPEELQRYLSLAQIRVRVSRLIHYGVDPLRNLTEDFVPSATSCIGLHHL
jgi:hypothetical protein